MGLGVLYVSFERRPWMQHAQKQVPRATSHAYVVLQAVRKQEQCSCHHRIMQCMQIHLVGTRAGAFAVNLGCC
jgi:hypothetical protein